MSISTQRLPTCSKLHCWSNHTPRGLKDLGWHTFKIIHLRFCTARSVFQVKQTYTIVFASQTGKFTDVIFDKMSRIDHDAKIFTLNLNVVCPADAVLAHESFLALWRKIRNAVVQGTTKYSDSLGPYKQRSLTNTFHWSVHHIRLIKSLEKLPQQSRIWGACKQNKEKTIELTQFDKWLTVFNSSNYSYAASRSVRND